MRPVVAGGGERRRGRKGVKTTLMAIEEKGKAEWTEHHTDGCAVRAGVRCRPRWIQSPCPFITEFIHSHLSK